MHFSRKSRPREFNTAGDRVQRIDDITTFLHLATNKCGLCRSTCATLSSDHASVIPTHDISWFRRSCRLSTSNTIRCVLHVSCHRDSELVAPRSDLFICERTRTVFLRERHLSSWCITEFGHDATSLSIRPVVSLQHRYATYGLMELGRWTPHMVMPVTPHGYAKFGYAGYAKHGYSICLCPIWLRHNSVSTESTTSYASCLMVRTWHTACIMAEHGTYR